MSKLRLDDMTIEQVRDLYNSMLKNLISKELLDKIYNQYLQKYNEMKEAERNGYTAPSGMGRRFNYLKNILYGWYIEDLFFLLIKQNPAVKNIEFSGDDAKHIFEYDHENKKISICGSKTTAPDFLITLNNDTKVYLELKTAAADIYSVKIGNVNQLQKTMGFTNIYSMIIMVDLVHEKYEIKDLSFFIDSVPFVNQRMEGQLCYDFPVPQKEFALLKDEKFEEYINGEMFNTIDVAKFRALKIAIDNKDKEKVKEIKNKITLDKLTNEFEFKKKEFHIKVEKLMEKTPNIQAETWEELLSELI